MTDFETLYLNIKENYDKLNQETQEMLETSQIYEADLDQQIKQLKKQVIDSRNSHSLIEEELKRVKELYKTEQQQSDKTIERLSQKCEQQAKELIEKKNRVVQLEIDDENERKQQRERDSLIRELESKLDGTLEQLELVKTQLESSRSQGEQKVERLKMELRDNQDELNVARQRKLKDMEEYTSKSDRHTPNQDKRRKESARLNLLNYSTNTSTGIENPSKFTMNIEMSQENEQSTLSMKSQSPQQEENTQNAQNTFKLNNHFQNCSMNIQSLRANNIGFSKSLDLISALIRDLDDKMHKIKGQTSD